jgi:hypothetical protein
VAVSSRTLAVPEPGPSSTGFTSRTIDLPPRVSRNEPWQPSLQVSPTFAIPFYDTRTRALLIFTGVGGCVPRRDAVYVERPGRARAAQSTACPREDADDAQPVGEKNAAPPSTSLGACIRTSSVRAAPAGAASTRHADTAAAAATPGHGPHPRGA